MISSVQKQKFLMYIIYRTLVLFSYLCRMQKISRNIQLQPGAQELKSPIDDVAFETYVSDQRAEPLCSLCPTNLSLKVLTTSAKQCLDC